MKKIGKKMYESYKEMSRAVGAKKPQEAQRAKALWAMKAAKDRGDKFYDPARKDNMLRTNKTRLEVWEEHLKDPIVALDKGPKVCGKSVLKLELARGFCGSKVAMIGDSFRSDSTFCGKRSFGLFWMHETVCVYAQPLRSGTSQGGTGRVASSSSSLRRKSQ